MSGGRGSTADPEANDTENDVQEELAAATSLDEDGQWRQKDAEDEEQDVSNGESCRSVHHLVCLVEVGWCECDVECFALTTLVLWRSSLEKGRWKPPSALCSRGTHQRTLVQMSAKQFVQIFLMRSFLYCFLS